MPILRGDAEISSSLRVTVGLFSGKSNGQWLVGCTFMGRYWGGGSIFGAEENPEDVKHTNPLTTHPQPNQLNTIDTQPIITAHKLPPPPTNIYP